MRKGLLFVPMMILLLASCAGGTGMSEAEELALTMRGEYLAMTGCTTKAAITADYGQRVYDFELTAAVAGEKTTMTLTAPEEVAGMTAYVEGKDGALEYDGVWVETGPLDDSGSTPISALPALLETARSGYMTACSLEEDGLLRVDCGDPEGIPGTGVEYTLWFDPETHALRRGEVRADGMRTILCEFTDFCIG